MIADEIQMDVGNLLRPPEEITVAEAAAKYMRTPRGPWDPAHTPYIVLPLNRASSREYQLVILVAPAQSGKTEGGVLGFLSYIMKCAPGDVLIVEKSFVDARDFSRRRLDRMFRNSPELKSLLSNRRVDDNTYDKFMKDGSIIKLAWPAINQLAGRPIKYGIATDYDRMPEDVDGEGTVVDHLRKRGTTYLSSATTFIESSPGREVLDPTWRPASPHEGPPATGIMALYNRGDRCRWYWRCRHCGNEFMPTFDRLVYDETGSPAARAATVVMPCPECGVIIRSHDKHWHNQPENGGRWLAEWEVMGGEPQTGIASFWLEGPAAADQPWESLVQDYLLADAEYQRTGDEQALKTTVSQSQGRPYLSRRLSAMRKSDTLQERAEVHLTARVVPPGARLLLSAVDIQSGRFVVQVVGFGPGRECWLIDRYDIALSARIVNGEPQSVDPASQDADWNLLTEKVLKASYPIDDGSGRHLRVKLTASDSAGQPGVTDRAYNYWRQLRRAGLGASLLLVKGSEGTRQGPRVQLTYPDTSNRKDRLAGARGDIPILMLNSNALKDALHADLSIDTPGPGCIHLPAWVENSFWDELTAEVRTDKKGWQKIGGRNEAWDLFCYARALLIHLGAEKWGDDWERCPPWARGWNENPLVFYPDKAQPAKPQPAAVLQRQSTGWIPRENKPWIR